MMIAIAIDDEPLALELIEAYCSNLNDLQLVQSFTNTAKAKIYLQNNTVDLIFLDIQMPNISGIDFYNNLEEKPLVIFTTAYSNYALKGFELNAIDYLLKPFDFERFHKAVIKAKEYFAFSNKSKNEVRYIYVRADYALIKIDCNEILFLESIDDYIKIHLLGKKPIMTLGTLKSMEEKLPNELFTRVHRSYIVSINKIESVKGKNIQMNASEIPISNKYEACFFKLYAKDIF
ncbi:MAG: response regulator transcription factor [Bacteroidetes bacterium]|nr:response regulator transcription factor [Bacteroidota bacterium]MBK9635238.1 response regulator transcription factor [Bacteroidota bacterium]MBL0080239.1 response regulator transcription factor [Bacteroidota bacterium]MBL0286056.1 response regulator transcription factor [Bacteroidota bacterium]